MKMTFKWLGVAGIELNLDGYTLLVDPFFTRPGLWAMLAGLARRPDPALAARYAPRCDYLLVTHPHYDHLLDAPEILRQTGARAGGSQNTVDMLGLHGLPRERVDLLALGDQQVLGPWSLSVLPNWHLRSPIDFLLNGPLRAGLAAKPPGSLPHLLDYRMDACFSYRLQAKNLNVQIGSHPSENLDLVFITPYQPAARLRALLELARPRCLVPIHWEDFFRSLSQPLRPIPLYRPGPREFARRVKAIAPECEVLIPAVLQEYEF